MKLKQPAIKTGVSNRHLHLSAADMRVFSARVMSLLQSRILDNLASLHVMKSDSRGSQGAITGVRVLGPPERQLR